MSENQSMDVEADGHVAWLTLCRPERRNAMGMAFFKELTDHFRRFDEDPAVRAVVIRATGKSFTAGLDLMEAGAMLTGKGADDRERLRKKILDLQESNNAIERCRKPVIAAVHGHCIGGGVDLLSACDIRLASADALFSIRETRIAIIADLGTLQRLPHIIGQGWFRELALTGRDFTAGEALQMGFVTRVCENREALIKAADDLAKSIAAMAPLTVQGVKEVINYSRDNGVYPGLSYVAQKNAASLPSEDLMEAVTAFMEKREPVFHGK
ncbi:crotonase/enoyl-CoA hydratase family protein [uncultured Desulfosarcina sp.]|uniref:crotonase/enoyl-CoA hydratase family protein n=1 Tax=uncultured Desulfosarcina sp. TaxID=218289 RepID=UPI0029C97AB2|nr:crotonase/enoyl-CoA hydratase family protein [uncultured Desulfosarcina sp.]